MSEQDQNDLRQLLKEILDDATGDVNDPQKRIWPIRAELYRKIATAIDYGVDR